ncbi:MAG: relaxase/mobilization nuclease domain-containing protein [Devosia sp.]
MAVFEKAIEEVEQRLGLSGQPRAIVFHEKQGRRHAHVVWSRIDAQKMKAINISHFKLKLREMSRELYLEHGWKMPRGLVNSSEANPLNFSLEEWQQAKRVERDPKRIKEIFKECWAISDSLKAFRSALEARGYYLARGDRRGYVALDWKGEAYSISRWADANTKAVEERLGALSEADTVHTVKAQIAEKMTKKLAGFAGDITLQFDNARLSLRSGRDELVLRQRNERKFFAEIQAARWSAESTKRSERIRRGIVGLWDRITGRYNKVRLLNEADSLSAMTRDAVEKQALIDRQLAERRQLQTQIQSLAKRRDREAEVWQSEIKQVEALTIEAPAPRQARARHQRHGPSL